MGTPLFLNLPRELRDHIYDYVFAIPDKRSPRALRIERRHLTYFTPTAPTILLVLHHECLLLNRQVAAEALDFLFKKHNVFLSCGPFVLNSFLYRIEQEPEGQGKKLLKKLRRIELDWITFPNLRHYPPEWYEENGNQGSGEYDDSWDYEGEGYDDNHYALGSFETWPAFRIRPEGSSSADPFGLSTLYPFADPRSEPVYDIAAQETAYEKLDYLVDREVTPLFAYLSSPTFKLSTMTLPLIFVSRQRYMDRSASRASFALPIKIRYWVKVVAHALIMLLPDAEGKTKLDELLIRYMPQNVWAAMDPSDDLNEMAKKGVWAKGNGQGSSAGEVFSAVWEELEQRRGPLNRDELQISVELVKWMGELEGRYVGDALEVRMTRSKASAL